MKELVVMFFNYMSIEFFSPHKNSVSIIAKDRLWFLFFIFMLFLN